MHFTIEMHWKWFHSRNAFHYGNVLKMHWKWFYNRNAFHIENDFKIEMHWKWFPGKMYWKSGKNNYQYSGIYESVFNKQNKIICIISWVHKYSKTSTKHTWNIATQYLEELLKKVSFKRRWCRFYKQGQDRLGYLV